jgi:cysteine sulfinate desulfinase/cysteine desulfurase-like protein
LRFSLGRFSTDEDVALAADTIRRAVTRLRGSAVPEPGMLA